MFNVVMCISYPMSRLRIVINFRVINSQVVRYRLFCANST